MPLYSPPSINRWLTTTLGGTVVTSQTFTAGTVLLAQFYVPTTCQIDGAVYTVGTTSAGNVTVGVVGPIARTADSPDAAVVVAQSASTAQTTANTLQLLTWTAVTVRPGLYYAALEGDNATGTYMRYSGIGQAPGLGATYARGGGYGTLTDPTPTTAANVAIVPGLRVRVV